MKLAKFKIKNFRCFKDEIVIDFNDLTAFIGKNDVGKSTISEALDIFFNHDGTFNLDNDDFGHSSDKSDFRTSNPQLRFNPLL